HDGKKASNAAPASARQNAWVSVCRTRYRKRGIRFLISCLRRRRNSWSIIRSNYCRLDNLRLGQFLFENSEISDDQPVMSYFLVIFSSVRPSICNSFFTLNTPET